MDLFRFLQAYFSDIRCKTNNLESFSIAISLLGNFKNHIESKTLQQVCKHFLYF